MALTSTQIEKLSRNHAHDLLLRCVRLFVAGAELPNVPQHELGQGKLFRSRQWNAAAAARAVFNFYAHYGKPAPRPESPVTLIDPARSSGA